MNRFFATLLATGCAASALAGTAPTLTTAATSETPVADEWIKAIKDAFVVYENDDTFVRKVRFSWLQQYQIASVQPNGSNSLHFKKNAEAFNQEFRRIYLGANVDFATGTQFHTWVRVGGWPTRTTWPGGRTKRNFTYTNFFDIWVSQDIPGVEGLSVKAGKLQHQFTTDYCTSSSAIPCVERSLLTNQFAMDSNWGVEVNYEMNKDTKFFMQLLANDRASTGKNTSHRDNYGDGSGFKGEFGWEDKCFIILGASHRFGVTESGHQRVTAQYMHDFNNAYHGRRQPGANNNGMGFMDALSLGYEYKEGPLTFQTNLVAAFESQAGQGSNNVGLQIQPVYAIHPQVDLVFRYTAMRGDRACKLSADRYIGLATTAPSWVDSIHAFYFGVDLYASAKYRNAAKLMFGAEYTTARRDGENCYNGWEFTSAVRWVF